MPKHFSSFSGETLDISTITAETHDERAAAPQLPEHISRYTIASVESESMTQPTSVSGGTIYEELLTFVDSNGHEIRRPTTIFQADGKRTETVPNTLIDSDPWTTGPRGLNREKIKMYLQQGFSGIWVSHADHHSPLQANKSVARSAHQMHRALDWLAERSEFDCSNVIVNGYSRGGMAAEKFIALSSLYKVNVVFSNLEAPSFAQDPSTREFLDIISQIPAEAIGVTSIVGELIRRTAATHNLEEIAEYARTFNLHPKNVIHESMWAVALFRAHVGPILAHLPRESAGLRTFFGSDKMSQEHHYREEYRAFPNIIVLSKPGPHVRGASPSFIETVKAPQQRRLGQLIIAGETLDPYIVAGLDTPQA